MEARIYLRTSYHGLRKAEGCYCGILEADTSKGEQTLEETGKDTGTANQIALLGLIKAMEHMRKPSDLRPPRLTYIYTKELINLSQPGHGNRINTECGAFFGRGTKTTHIHHASGKGESDGRSKRRA